MSEQTKPSPPPYLPYRTFRGYIQGLKASGVPAKIDRSVLRNRSGGEQTMILNTLQYLGMITTDGTPTPNLTELVSAADGPDYQKVLRDVLMTRFIFLFGDGFYLESATPSMVKDAFSQAGVSGDTVRKAVAFFLAAAQDAQIPLSSYLKGRAGRTIQRRRQRPIGQANGEIQNEASPAPGATTKPKSLFQTLIDILDTENMTDEEQQAVWTLIRYLKKKGGSAVV